MVTAVPVVSPIPLASVYIPAAVLDQLSNTTQCLPPDGRGIGSSSQHVVWVWFLSAEQHALAVCGGLLDFPPRSRC